MSVRGLPTAVLVLLTMGRGALGGAQEPKGDSLRRDSAHVRQCVDCMMIVFPAAALGLAAPSAFLSVIDSTTAPSRREYGNTHLAAYLTGGPVASQNPDLGWTHGQDIEVLAYGVLADVRVEQYYLFPQHLGYVTSHLGFIMPSQYGLAGGITFGYRGVRGPPVIGRQEGIEITLPLIWSRGDAWWRFESYYVGSTHGTNWNYRVQGEWPLGGTRYVAGVKAETMALPIRDRSNVSWVTLTALLGIHR